MVGKGEGMIVGVQGKLFNMFIYTPSDPK